MKIILLMTSVLGLALVIISRAQNLFFLFFGVGLTTLSILAILLKKYAQLLAIPFVILLAGLLFIFNRLDLRANLLQINFINSQDHLASFTIDYADSFRESQEFPVGLALPNLEIGLAEQIVINFKKLPILLPDDFILTDYFGEEQSAVTTWLWSDDSKWNKISEVDYLHIYDPLLDIYYPDERTALLLVDRLEFSLLDFDNQDGPVVVKRSITELYFRSEPSPLTFNSPLDYLVIDGGAITNPDMLEVRVNTTLLGWEKTMDGWHYFRFDDPVQWINSIQITEKEQPQPRSLISLQPQISAVYALESDPGPIVIDNIGLYKYFGSINRRFSFYEWDANSLMTAFSANEGILSPQDGLLQLTPAGLHSSIKLEQSPAMISALGLASFTPYIWGGNLLITFIVLLSFLATSLLFNRYLDVLKPRIPAWITAVKSLGRAFSTDWKIHQVTPFKIFFLSFLVLSWVIFLTSAVEPVWLLFALFLSIFSTYYVIKDLEIKRQ